jgi:hypothetical protein
VDRHFALSHRATPADPRQGGPPRSSFRCRAGQKPGDRKERAGRTRAGSRSPSYAAGPWLRTHAGAHERGHPAAREGSQERRRCGRSGFTRRRHSKLRDVPHETPRQRSCARGSALRSGFANDRAAYTGAAVRTDSARLLRGCGLASSYSSRRWIGTPLRSIRPWRRDT